MDQFSISDIETLSGIKAHTLRIWEQRYRILTPKRKESQHRFYDNEDLKRILQIAQLNRTGYKISKIARLTEDELRQLAGQLQKAEISYESHIQQLAEACIQFDEDRFHTLYTNIQSQVDMERIVLHIFYPLLERMGTWWMTNETRPVQEHFVSNQIARKMMVAVDGLELPVTGPVTLLFNPEGEHHEIPLLFIHYLLKRSGKRVAFMGCNATMEALKIAVTLKEINRLQLHVITNFSGKTANDLLKELLEEFPKQQIVLSGPLATQVTLTHKRLTVLHSLQELLKYCGGEDKF